MFLSHVRREFARKIAVDLQGTGFFRGAPVPAPSTWVAEPVNRSNLRRRHLRPALPKPGDPGCATAGGWGQEGGYGLVVSSGLAIPALSLERGRPAVHTWQRPRRFATETPTRKERSVKKTTKLSLGKETLRSLDETLALVRGGGFPNTQTLKQTNSEDISISACR